MAEISYFWDAGLGDDGPYTSDDYTDFLRFVLTGTSGEEGVVWNIGNALKVGTISGPPDTVTVETGASVIDGTPYRNTSLYSQVMPTSPTGTYYVTISKYWALKYAVLTAALGSGTDIDGTQWFQSLASFTLSGTGAITNLTDLREFATTLIKSPHARAYHNATQSIGTSSTETVLFNQERFDTHSFHDNSTNNSRLTIPYSGRYLVCFSGTVTGGASGTDQKAITAKIKRVSPLTTSVIAKQSHILRANTDLTFSLCTYIFASKNNYFEVDIENTSTDISATLQTTGNTSPEFSISLLSVT